MIKNYTKLIYVNQLKTRICRSVMNVIQKEKHNTIQKAQKTQCFGSTFSPNYTVTKVNDFFQKKKNHPFSSTWA